MARKAAKLPRLLGIKVLPLKTRSTVMPPFLLSPLVKWTLAALGGAMVVHWVVKEARRVNEELDRAKRAAKISDRENMPTLRRDPSSGEYRL
jgi:hypothetical protein